MSQSYPSDPNPSDPTPADQTPADNRGSDSRSSWEERRERREERREMRQGGAWIGGAILILLGLVFLLQNMGVLSLDNWWALFILIPAFGSFSAAWGQYQAAGRLTAGARGSLIGGLFLSMVAAAFLFELNWAFLWPVFLIAGGLALLLNALLPG